MDEKTGYALMKKAQSIAKIGAWEIDLSDMNITWTEEVNNIHELPPNSKPKLEDGINFYAPEARQEITDAVNQGVEKGIPWDKTLPFITAKGNKRWVRAMGFPEVENGKTVKLLGVFQDVTDKYLAEEELRLANMQLQLVLEGSEAGIWDWFDVNSDKEWWSPQFYKLLGYDNNEISATLDNFKNFLHEDDIADTFSQIDKCFKEQSKFEIEYRLKTKSDGYKWFLGTGTVQFDGDHKPIRMIGSIIDINDKKKVELKLEQTNEVYNKIIESSMSGYWDWFIQDNYEYYSPGFRKMFGYTKEELPNTPESWQKIIFKADLPGVFENYDQHVTSKGKIPYDNEVRYRHKDGSTVWVYCRGEVLEWDESGQPIRMVGSHVNITPLKLAEKLLSKKLLELEDKNGELKQFAYVASHDLQEPLRVITSYLDLFEHKYEEVLDEQGKKYIDRVVDGANRMKRLINDLLLLSRVENNKVELKKVSLDNIINNVIRDIELLIEEKQAIIKFDKLPDVYGDYSELYQLFLNLIGNGIKFHRKEMQPLIEISSKTKKRRLEISIKDNGIGIENKHLDRIFVIFQRLHTRMEYDGTGIGLALCQKIVNRHKGKLSVKSVPGTGSTFSFDLKAFK